MSTSATWARVAEGEGHTVHTAPLPRVAGPSARLSAAVLVRTTRSPSRRQPASAFPPRSPHPRSLPTDPRRQQPNLRPPPPPRRLLAGSLPRPPIPRCPSADSVAHCAGAAASPRPQPRRTERRAPSPRKTRYVPATAPAPLRPAELRPAACPFSPLPPLAGARSRLPCDSRRARGANTAEFKGCLQDPPHAVVLRVLLSTFWAVLLASAAAFAAAACNALLLCAHPSCSHLALSSLF